MRQAGVLATAGNRLGDNILLADVALGNVPGLTPAASATFAAFSRTLSRSVAANCG